MSFIVASYNIANKGIEYTNHMLKNRTSKMDWCIANLKERFISDNDEVPEEIMILSRSVEELNNYVEKIRKQSQVIHISAESCSLKSLLEKSIAPYEHKAIIELELEYDITIICDKTHMAEVFLNIISNAVEASQNPAEIEISAKIIKKGDFCRITFTDHGIGMDEENAAKMFKPYFTTKSTDKNFGLGLTYCKNVINMHGGNIVSESSPGKGTSIKIEIPMKFKERIV